jgi:hypothetical protein
MPSTPYDAASQPHGRDPVQDVLNRDPYGSIKNQVYSPNNFPLAIGYVNNAFAYNHCYWVTVPFLGYSVVCKALTSSSLDVFSTKENNTYTAGTLVLVYMPSATEGIILGAVPSLQIDSSLQIPDLFNILGNAGFPYDKAHSHPIDRDQETASGLINYSCARALDILPGDYAQINQLGLGMLLGQFMASIRATDLARLDLFYLDHFVRLAAYNFQRISAGYLENWLNDENEISGEKFLTPYPWEALGLKAPGEGFKDGEFNLNSNDKEPGKAPTAEKQTGIYRFQKYQGFLGDLEKTIVLGIDQDGTYPETYESENKHFGLLEQTFGIDGSYTLRTAKQILFSKHVLIPVPKRLKKAEDGEGDSSTDAYKAAGLYGEGPEHTKKEFEWGRDDFPGIRGNQTLDLHSYLFNWYQQSSVFAHKKDFKLKDSKELKLGEIDKDRSHIEGLKTRFQTPLPKVATVQIDHRTGAVKYYQSTSSFGMLDDGSVVIEDGYGSQIKMSGGNISITCPGDVWLQPGRNLISMAPKDTIIRSGKSVDITASKKDVRIKAENNFHVLAGNDTPTGGIFLESRAKTKVVSFADKAGDEVITGGIIFKSENAPLISITKDVYIRTLDGGRIYLDADGKKGDLIVSSKNNVFATTGNFIIALGASFDADTSKTKTIVFSSTSSSIGTPLAINGSTVISSERGNANLVVNGNIIIDGRIASSVGQKEIPRLEGDSLERFNNQIQQTQDRLTTNTNDLNDAIDGVKRQLREGDDAWGSKVFIDSLRFSFRTDEQYGFQDDDSFIIWEAPWQQFYRFNKTTEIWDEPPVKAAGDVETFPFPGKANWSEHPKYGISNPKFYDVKELTIKDRPYDENKSSDVDFKSLSGGYLITTQE